MPNSNSGSNNKLITATSFVGWGMDLDLDGRNPAPLPEQSSSTGRSVAKQGTAQSTQSTKAERRLPSHVVDLTTDEAWEAGCGVTFSTGSYVRYLSRISPMPRAGLPMPVSGMDGMIVATVGHGVMLFQQSGTVYAVNSMDDYLMVSEKVDRFSEENHGDGLNL